MDQDFEHFFEDNDEEIIDYVRRQRTYVVRLRPDHFQIWSDDEFYNRFRLKRDTVFTLHTEIENLLKYKTTRNFAIDTMIQLLITLRFYATGDMYIVVGDFGGMHKTTAGKIIKRVTEAIISLRNQYIYMPQNRAELLTTQERFFKIARFPRVIGAVDGTHIRIVSPGGPNAEHFRNRKGFFSLNVQVVCNADNIITDIVCRWPGAVHDSTIFNNSYIKVQMEIGRYDNGILLGDSGYPLCPYLLTPLANPEGDAQELYNTSHIKTRTVVERTFGIWKRRFPVLSIGMRCATPLQQDVIVATAILHNLAIRASDRWEADEDNEIAEVDLIPQNEVRINNIQHEFIDYFNTLL